MADDVSLSGALPVPVPYIAPEAAPYWAGAREGRLVLPFCKSCETVIWYPKAHCNACGSLDVDWRQASGEGVLYSFSNVHRGEGPYRETGNFILALVDLDEGARVLTNIVDSDPEALQIGQRVRAVFHPAGDTAALVRFAPASAT